MIYNGKVICDTGVLSRYFTIYDKPKKKDIIEIFQMMDKIGFENVIITAVNRIELLNWLSNYQKLSKSARAFVKKTIKAIPFVHINEPISKLAIELSDKHINSKPADTFIAAIAIYHKIPIYTLNIKDFELLKAPLL